MRSLSGRIDLALFLKFPKDKICGGKIYLNENKSFKKNSPYNTSKSIYMGINTLQLNYLLLYTDLILIYFEIFDCRGRLKYYSYKFHMFMVIINLKGVRFGILRK